MYAAHKAGIVPVACFKQCILELCAALQASDRHTGTNIQRKTEQQSSVHIWRDRPSEAVCHETGDEKGTAGVCSTASEC